MPIIIYPDRHIEEVSPRNGRKFTLEEAQKIVGGYIQLFFLYDTDDVLVFNEEGKVLDLPFNSLATHYARCNDPLFTDHLVGNVLVCKKSEI